MKQLRLVIAQLQLVEAMFAAKKNDPKIKETLIEAEEKLSDIVSRAGGENDGLEDPNAPPK